MSLWYLKTLSTAVQGECRAELARAMLSRSQQCLAPQLRDKITKKMGCLQKSSPNNDTNPTPPAQKPNYQ